ncbi:MULTISPECIES: hypothetical protein [Bacteria]|uniref:hypothetical protein n=1 Tax=Bacteria TaxID=2 RepID=UPI0011E02DA4|nr:hypothetical protein [Stenotrophomonas maltophilia]MBH1475929.1 hypothetical protein [Stenotrophomonas maltophilia]MBH1501565.1 hypothetical protein [Stenotrophomonas maltophilia]MBH1784674.1 hypothetical protein [Stenotrophomonas maltophilia]
MSRRNADTPSEQHNAAVQLEELRTLNSGLEAQLEAARSDWYGVERSAGLARLMQIVQRHLAGGDPHRLPSLLP